MSDEKYMKIALEEAKKAKINDEIPVGAIVVKDDEIIARAYNKKNQSNKVKDHAEMIALELANEKLENWRLEECEIYITLEPCPMCASAIEQSRIRRIVTGAQNNNEQTKLVTEQILKNRSWKKQVLEEECTELINEFFKSKR